MVRIITAFLLIIAVELFSAVVHPVPEGFGHTPEEMCRHVENYPNWVLMALVPMWGATALVSVWLAGKVGHLHSVFVVGTLLLAAVTANIAMLPYSVQAPVGFMADADRNAQALRKGELDLGFVHVTGIPRDVTLGSA